MNYGLVRSVGEEASSIQGEFEALFKSVDSLISGIDGSWQGAAKKEFMTAFDKMKPRFNAVSSNLKSYAAALPRVALIEEDTESQTAGTFHGF